MSDSENPNLNAPQPPKPSNMPPYPPPYPPYQRPRRTNWWIPIIIIGGIVVLFFVFIAVIFSTFAGSFSTAFEDEKVEVRDNSILYVTFSGGMNEYSQQNPFAAFGGGDLSGASFLETINAIKLAKKDDKIKGIYIKPSFSPIGWAKAQEIQDVLNDFKSSGKFIYAFIEVGDEAMYYNTLAADTIFMPTEGIMEMNGFGASSLFLTGLMDKIGVKYHVEHFEDFKSAADMYKDKKYGDSAKYQLRVLLNQRYNTFTNAIADRRKLSHESIKNALDRGVYTADSLKALGFIDVLATEQSVKEFLKAKVEGKKYDFDVKNYTYEEPSKKDTKIKLLSVTSYLSGEDVSQNDVVYDENTQIAIINGVGAITSGTAEGGFGGEYEIKSGDFVKYLKTAREDKNIKAIILRIDSPGGSVIASDEIWEEIMKTRKVKPVYASMANVAASGGYYMAMACDTIIAHPSTITGSIGVVMAVPNLSGLMGKLDLTADTINTNSASQFMNGMFPYDDKQKAQLHQLSQNIYYRFLNRVAESRGKTFDEIRAVAKGRVWTGEDAHKIGLVDTLGGMQTTLNIAKRRLGINPDTKVRVRIFPEKEDEFQAILKMFGLKKSGDEDVSSKIDFAKALGLDAKSLLMSIDAMPEEMKKSIYYSLNISKIAQKENALVAMPYLIEIK